nr:MAG TPA: hypothetical protein [Bacteriophage sp.]
MVFSGISIGKLFHIPFIRLRNLPSISKRCSVFVPLL